MSVLAISDLDVRTDDDIQARLWYVLDTRQTHSTLILNALSSSGENPSASPCDSRNSIY